MQNKRFTRVKVIKGLYAFEHCKKANYELACKQLSEVKENPFEIDVADAQSKEMIFFNHLIKTEQSNLTTHSSTIPIETTNFIYNVVNQYKKNNKRDSNQTLQFLKKDQQTLSDKAWEVIQLVFALAHQDEIIVEEKNKISIALGNWLIAKPIFTNNKVLEKIKNSEEFKVKNTAHSMWNNKIDLIDKWTKTLLYKNAFIQKYKKKEQNTYKQDWELVRHTIDKIILKNNAISSFFDEKDINWQENSYIIRKALLQMLDRVSDPEKSIDFSSMKEGRGNKKEFLISLYSNAVEKSNYFEELISKFLKKWTTARMAVMDGIIIKVALSEMMTFNEIPIKVSLNEYIEIAKRYSTPKSSIFINGMLDAISKLLIKEKVIIKTGQGLIKNNISHE